jgi:hypothetical protein
MAGESARARRTAPPRRQGRVGEEGSGLGLTESIGSLRSVRENTWVCFGGGLAKDAEVSERWQ